MSLSLRQLSGSGYCDFCKTRACKTVQSSEDTDRDICLECLKTGMKLFNETSFISKTLTMFSSLMKRLLDKDTQVLIKAGFLNNDLSLTNKGEEEVMALMLMQNKTDLVKVAEEKLAEEAEKKA